MLLLLIRSYIESVPKYALLILDTYHPDSMYLHEKGCKDPWLFCEVKRSLGGKKLGNTVVTTLPVTK